MATMLWRKTAIKTAYAYRLPRVWASSGVIIRCGHNQKAAAPVFYRAMAESDGMVGVPHAILIAVLRFANSANGCNISANTAATPMVHQLDRSTMAHRNLHEDDCREDSAARDHAH